MAGIEFAAVDVIAVLTHVKRWISNLKRAGSERKAQSRKALRSVILAVRETQVYVRKLKEGGRKSIKTEKALSLRWTNLSFDLQDIGLKKLSNRCRVTGKYWADPGTFEKDFLSKLAKRLDEIEQFAVLADREND